MDGGFLAVGTDTHGTAIWRATSIGSLARVDTDRFVLADLTGLSPTSVGIVASGTALDLSIAGDAGFPTIWSSADGTTWSAPIAVGDMDRGITRVVDLHGRLAALVIGNGAPPELVSSTDGRSWNRVATVGTENAYPADIVVAGSRLVAVGQTEVAAAWYSDDGGASWLAASVPPGGTDSTMTSVAVGPEGLVAVGSVTDPSGGPIPAAWFSADGMDWALVAQGTGSGRMAAIAHGADGWVSVGSNDIDGGQDQPRAAQLLGLTAVSGNGRAWTFLGPAQGAELESVVATPSGWLAAGRRGTDAMLWTSGTATLVIVEGGYPAVTPLACPPASETIDLARLLAIPDEKRLACLGRTQVTFRAWVVPQGGRGGTCGGQPTWLTCRLNVPADQVAAYPGLTGPTLGVTPRPGATMPASWGGILPAGTWVWVMGHFDDPAASTCSVKGMDTRKLVAWCRSQFVATRVSILP